MKLHACIGVSALFSLCGVIFDAHLAAAAEGPGIGNLTYQKSELYKAISYFDGTNGTPKDSPSKAYGHNVVIMSHGYLMLLYAPDSGKPTGGFLFYDVSNPRKPKLVNHVRDENTKIFRETHSLPVAVINGRHYLALQTVEGVQIWDLSDAPKVSHVKSLKLEGVDGGDYTNVSWQLSWQWPYLFVAGGNQGIYVVDTTEPSKASLLARIPISKTGGYRVGPLFAMGNLLVIANMDQNGQYSLVDITRPDQASLVKKIAGMTKLYSMGVLGDLIYGAGRVGDLYVHRFTQKDIVQVSAAKIEGDGLYVSMQDQFVHYGQTHGYKKVDVSDPSNPKQVVSAVLDRDHTDHGQTTAFGNLVFIGNDHGTGSAFLVHQTEPDQRAPSVVKIYPEDRRLNVPLSSRITIAFSDTMNVSSFEQNVVVHEVGGGIVDGAFSYLFNTLSFGPKQPLKPNTTYQVTLRASGVQDSVGNALGEQVVSTFATGSKLSEPDPDPPVGSAGNTGSAGSPATNNGGTSGTDPEPEPDPQNPGFGGGWSPTTPNPGNGGVGTVPEPSGKGGRGGVRRMSDDADDAAGCTCRTVPSSTRHSAFAALLGVAAVLLGRRKRRTAQCGTRL